MKKEESFQEQEAVVRYIGRIYMQSKTRMEIMQIQNCVCQNSKTYQADQGLVLLVDRLLENCGKDTCCIIRKEYLEKSESKWYQQYYSRSTYYHLKKAAITEFLRCLDI